MNLKQWKTILEEKNNFYNMDRQTLREMQSDNVVYIGGESDDLILMQGVINEEEGAWDGTFGTIINTIKGPKYINKKRYKEGIKIELKWDYEGYSWYATADCEFEEIIEIDDDSKFRNIILNLDELKKYEIIKEVSCPECGELIYLGEEE